MSFRDLFTATVTPRGSRRIDFVPKCGYVFLILPSVSAEPLRLRIACAYGSDGVCARCKRHRDGA
jgi:hypothetical protein